jgi:hypothetical protein
MTSPAEKPADANGPTASAPGDQSDPPRRGPLPRVPMGDPRLPADDVRLGVIQHVLFWTGAGLLIGLAVSAALSKAFVFEVYARQNLLLPSPEYALRRRWWLTLPAVAALAGCFYLRLRRMVGWREAGVRPAPSLAVRAYLGATVAALGAAAALVFAESLLLLRPDLLGDARLYLPRAGAYLVQDMDGPSVAGYDHSLPDIGCRYVPDSELTSVTCGDVIENLGSQHLLGAVPYRKAVVRVDADGFRGFGDGRPADSPADIVVVGDSFIAAANLPVKLALPYRLGKLTGRPTYSMAVSGSGPQQELAFLKRFGDKHKPKVVVWCFFEGNDLWDAMHWDRDFASLGRIERGVRFDRIGTFPEPVFERRWQCSALAALWRHSADRRASGGAAPTVPDAGAEINSGLAQKPAATPPPADADEWEDAEPPGTYLPASHSAPYDRSRLLPNRRWEEVAPTGLRRADRVNPVRATVGGRTVEMSVAYYRDLGRSREEIAAHAGWEPLRRTLRDFRDHCQARGVRLLLAYIPVKANVYWDAMAPELDDARFDADPGGSTAWSGPRITGGLKARIAANRLAMRDLLAGESAREGVEFLDLTAALTEASARGAVTYLHHDTHWSPEGHRVAAEAVRRHLTEVLKWLE